MGMGRGAGGVVVVVVTVVVLWVWGAEATQDVIEEVTHLCVDYKACEECVQDTACGWCMDELDHSPWACRKGGTEGPYADTCTGTWVVWRAQDKNPCKNAKSTIQKEEAKHPREEDDDPLEDVSLSAFTKPVKQRQDL